MRRKESTFPEQEYVEHKQWNRRCFAALRTAADKRCPALPLCSVSERANEGGREGGREEGLFPLLGPKFVLPSVRPSSFCRSTNRCSVFTRRLLRPLPFVCVMSDRPKKEETECPRWSDRRPDTFYMVVDSTARRKFCRNLP